MAVGNVFVGWACCRDRYEVYVDGKFHSGHVLLTDAIITAALQAHKHGLLIQMGNTVRERAEALGEDR